MELTASSVKSAKVELKKTMGSRNIVRYLMVMQEYDNKNEECSPKECGTHNSVVKRVWRV